MEQLPIHHIGRVVKDIKAEYNYYQKLGHQIYKDFQEPKQDIQQKVLVGVIQCPNVLLELLEPLSQESPIYKFQQNGGGYHHVCYEILELENTMNYIKEQKIARNITATTTSVWDGGRPVTFFLSNSGDIFELIGPKQ